MLRSSSQMFHGSYSASFSTVGSHGPAYTFPIAVTPGELHVLRVAYMTLGGGGFIGVDKLDASMNLLGEDWLIGDGGDVSMSLWDCNVSNCPPEALGVRKVYTQRYTIPEGVHFIRIQIQDFVGGLPNDPATKPVYAL